MTYEQATHLAQTWGLGILLIVFGVACIYALWPGNSEKFKSAARTPLQEENDDGRPD